MRAKLLAVLITIFAISSFAFAGEPDSVFRSNLYKRVEIQKTATIHVSYPAPLTERQKKALEISKNNIVSFLVKLNNSDNAALQYLGNTYKRQFKDAVALYQSYFEAESLLTFEIYDFNILDKDNKIVIYAEITEAAEGNEFIKPIKFYLTDYNGEFKIDKIENLG